MRGALVPVARRLRREQTEAERKLWAVLRRPPFAAHKFRRQVPFAPRYIVDFCSHSARLIVELDGGQHGDAAHAASDIARTRYLEARGYSVLRFWNADMANAEAVADTILAADPSPSRSCAAGPSLSRKGRG